MIFKKIKTENFRQFKGVQEILFSTNPEKMITLIDGNNGAGKTTLVQAFNWCLFGPSNTNLDTVNHTLNNEVFEKLEINETGYAKVWIVFEHEGIDYTVERSQATTKKRDGSRNVFDPIVRCSKKNRQTGISEIEELVQINRIIPRQLSTYFFFDGERMKHLNDSRFSQQDLSETITKLMGLDLLKSSQEHMDAVRRYFRASKDTKTNVSADIVDQIQSYKSEISRLRTENGILDNHYTQDLGKIEDISNKLRGYDPIKAKEKQRMVLEVEKIKTKELIDSGIYDYFNNFWNNGYRFILLNAMQEVYERVNDSEIIDKGVDGIQSNAIDEIIAKGECICGTTINLDSEEYHHLIDLKRYLPPENLSGLLRGMRAHIEASRSAYDKDYCNLKKKFGDVLKQRTELNKIDRSLDNISDEIKRYGDEFNRDISDLESTKRELDDQNKKRQQKIGFNKREIARLEAMSSKLEKSFESQLKSTRRNEQIDDKMEICLLIKSRLETIYREQEEKLRTKLQTSISDTLSQILHANRTVRIDEKYNFIAEDEYGNRILSEGQKVVISFSYVKAIIEISKEINSKRSNFHNSSTELPLVMDAPLATLDPIHRLNVCRVLPEFSKQIILFTTMSQLDEESENILGKFIDKRYELSIVKDSAHTEIVESN